MVGLAHIDFDILAKLLERQHPKVDIEHTQTDVVVGWFSDVENNLPEQKKMVKQNVDAAQRMSLSGCLVSSLRVHN